MRSNKLISPSLILLTLSLLITSSPAMALKCAYPNPFASWQKQVDNATDALRFEGQFTAYDEAIGELVPEGKFYDINDNEVEVEKLTFKSACIATWCGSSPQLKTDLVAIVQPIANSSTATVTVTTEAQKINSYHLSSHACNSTIFKMEDFKKSSKSPRFKPILKNAPEASKN